MAHLKYYTRTREFFKEAYAEKLTDDEAHYFFGHLKLRWRLPQFMVFHGYRGSGKCSKWRVRLSHEPSLGLFAHEVAHALQFRDGNKTKNGRKRGWHTKRHMHLMAVVISVVKKYQDEWCKLKQCKESKKLMVERARFAKQQEIEQLRKTPEYQLKILREREKRLASKQKRLTTLLKKVRRRIKIWDAKARVNVEIASKNEAVEG